MSIKIGILTPVCSRNSDYDCIENTPLFTTLIPNLLPCADEADYSITFFIGIDDNDEFYLKHKKYFEDQGMITVILADCNHKPAKAWNNILKVAYEAGCEYFFQIGDDVKLLAKDWNTTFINKLKETNNVGVVGPNDIQNVYWRQQNSMTLVIEQAFFHRTHFEIFKTLFHRKIDNVYCDDWLTQVYYRVDPLLSSLCSLRCENSIRNKRYLDKPVPKLETYIQEGVRKLLDYFSKSTSKKSKKIISFSLWGDDPKYTIGAVKNAELALTIYPTWTCRFYTGKSVPMYIIEKLRSFSNTEIFMLNEDGDWSGMFWRFFPVSEKDIDVVIIRDTDSRLNLREKTAVDEWINSEYDFHIMRDHPYHGYHILGGMWGVKGGTIEHINSLINLYCFKRKSNYYQIDNDFLRDFIYNETIDNAMVHDEFFTFESYRKPFPTSRISYEFVGEVFNEHDSNTDQHTHALRVRLDRDNVTKA